MRKKKRRVVLEIDSLAAGGDGVARDENGRVHFVARGVPGDRVLVELSEEKKQFARGRVVELLVPGPNRQDPVCELFASDRCGGCQWQSVDSATQRAAKEAIVDNGLRRLIQRGLERHKLLEPCRGYGWRRRARMSYWVGEQTFLGFFSPRSNKITDVVNCPQLEPGLERAVEVLRTYLLPELRQRGEVELLLADDGRCHVAVHGTATAKGLKELAAQPSIAGVINGKRKYGAETVKVEGGIESSAADFVQASKDGNLALCEVVKSALGNLPGKSVLELYAGGGNFTRMMTDAERVVAVDYNPIPRIADWGAPMQWRDGDVADVVQSLVDARQKFDVILLDPPRSGSRDVVENLAALGATKIIYVSCNVATLARDVEMLCERGYRAVSAQPLDLMPQTSHVETVVVLRKDDHALVSQH